MLFSLCVLYIIGKYSFVYNIYLSNAGSRGVVLQTWLWVSIPTLLARQSAVLSSTQHAMPPEFSGMRRT